MTMYDFWHNTNNPSLAQSEYLYGPRHIFVLAMVALFAIYFSFAFRKKSEKGKDILFYVLASILLIFEVTSRVVDLIIAQNYTVMSVLDIILPKHICSVMVWIFIIAIFTKSKALLRFSVVGGLLATVVFLLYPAVGLNKVYMSFTCLYSTISHSIGFICAILLMTLRRVDFKFKDFWKMLLCFALMFGWGALLDFVIFEGSNYMYLVENPLEMTTPIPYQVLYAIILFLYILMYYCVYSAIVNFRIVNSRHKLKNAKKQSDKNDKKAKKQSDKNDRKAKNNAIDKKPTEVKHISITITTNDKLVNKTLQRLKDKKDTRTNVRVK